MTKSTGCGDAGAGVEGWMGTRTGELLLEASWARPVFIHPFYTCFYFGCCCKAVQRVLWKRSDDCFDDEKLILEYIAFRESLGEASRKYYCQAISTREPVTSSPSRNIQPTSLFPHVFSLELSNHIRIFHQHVPNVFNRYALLLVIHSSLDSYLVAHVLSGNLETNGHQSTYVPSR